ncbi:MAG: PAS domain-containing protein [Anaerolineae bacterium]|nr:PAS domain-containing protein [Anaerolineae bacterium]
MNELTAFNWEIEIRHRRNSILNHMLATGTIGGGIGIVLLFIAAIGNPLAQRGDMAPFVVIWFFVLGVWLFRGKLNYQVRTWTLLLLVYFLGCYLLLDGGLTGSGRIWLLLGPLLAVVMLDVWPGGVLAGASSILIYILFAIIMSFGVLPQKSGEPTDLGYWITEGGDFLIAVAGLVLGMWGFRRGWFEALKKTSAINQKLEGAMRDLQVLNTELDTRVIERTQQLAGALARNEAVLAGIADGVAVFDQMGRVSTINPAMGALLGRPPDKMVGQTIEALMGRDVAEPDREMVGRLLRDGEITWSGFKLKWGEKTFAVSIAPVHSDTGMVAGMVAVFRDFTREAEIDQMKSLFVSIASHDLRTPLNSILGYTEMLYEGIYGELAGEQREIVGRVVANTRHMLGLANNLLDRAQIEAGTIAFHYAPLSPSELVTDTMSVMEVLARAQGLAVASEIAEGVPGKLLGDRQRLDQILVNLVSNAIKYTDDGEIRVRVYLPDDGRWALEVSDTGRGISRDDQARVFEPFRRASGLPGYGGSGLGLSIVKQLVEMMRGEIRLRSEVGRGSTFTIILPLRPD